MLLQSDIPFKCLLAFFAFTWIIAGYTYTVNARRTAWDPNRRDYHPFAVIIAPIFLLIFLPLAIIGFILTAVLYAAFLILFVILLVLLRRPFIFRWWDRFATSIGNPLLRINTRLVRLALSPLSPSSS